MSSGNTTKIIGEGGAILQLPPGVTVTITDTSDDDMLLSVVVLGLALVGTWTVVSWMTKKPDRRYSE